MINKQKYQKQQNNKPNLFNQAEGKTKRVINFIENKPNPYDYYNEYKDYIEFENRREKALNQLTANNMLNIFFH